MGMTNQIRNPNDDGGFVRFAVLIGASLAGMAACWWAAGASLGLFFGGLFVATFLAPAGVLEKSLARSITGLLVVVAPIAGAWLIPMFKNSDTPAQLSQAALVLFAYALALGGIALALARIGIPHLFANAAAILLGFAWLTWPAWLAPALVRSGDDRTVQNLVIAHPPLTINGILVGDPAWTERSVAYHLTDLNQDVPIRLPANAAACAAIHGILGLLLWGAAWARRGKSPSAVLNSSTKPHTVVPNVQDV
jgi:hypothetical protein